MYIFMFYYIFIKKNVHVFGVFYVQNKKQKKKTIIIYKKDKKCNKT